MKKNNENAVSEITQLAANITEESKKTLKNILSEAVSDFLKEEVLNEDDDEDNETDDDIDIDTDTSDLEKPAKNSDDTTEETEVEDTPMEADDELNNSETEEDEWADFDDYKIGEEDGSEEYDFTNETDPDTLVKVFKLMKNDDQVSVVKDGDKVSIKDNEAGTEYVIELDCEQSCENNEENFDLTMEESIGYTDNYQSKDPIQGLSMSNSGKNTKDWHKGVPTGTNKPWAGKGSSEPFNNKIEKVFEITLNDETDNDEFIVDEATNVGGFVQQNTTSKSHVPNSNGRKARNMSKDGEKKTGTADPRYSGVNETLEKRMNAALAENKKLKESINKVAKIMKEAVQVNVNLGHIVRLITENTTTKKEKEDIIKRFNKVKTNDEAKSLYESISSELKKTHSTIVTEQATTTQDSKKINEYKIYEEPNGVRDMMRRMNLIK